MSAHREARIVEGGDAAPVERRRAYRCAAIQKVTVPVGVPVPDKGITLAVNVTVCLRTDGFGEDVREVVVPIRLLTVCVKTEDVLALSLASPL